MSLESRMVLPNMMAEFGAKNAWIAPDKKTVAYLEQRLKSRDWGQGRNL
jgi:homoaconitase/3-isopropylmalate dehydratase large subunit